MSRWVAGLPLIVLAALAVLFAGYALHRNPQVQPQALVGKPMPDLTLPDLASGTPVRLRDTLLQGYGGGPVAMPLLILLAQQQDLVLLGRPRGPLACPPGFDINDDDRAG